MDNSAMFKISYGLYVLSAKEGQKDNGCISNTVVQVTSDPNRITVALNKNNYTTGMISSTGEFNVSMLDETVSFDVFKNFGFRSGKLHDKFEGIEFERSENGIAYLPKNTSAFISAKVHTITDLGTHLLFLADVVDGKVLSDVDSVTYTYYQKNIKPKPQAQKSKGYVCKVCGYVYEGEPLPADFICPICKHDASYFEKIV